MLKRLLLAVYGFLTLATLPNVAGASFMLPPQGYRAKDFALIRHDGLYHLYYIRRKLDAPDDSTENDLGHAISTDLISWTQLGPVLPVRPDKWDNLHIWAPHIVESNGVFYMFYTGVTRTPGVFSDHQRIGVATSTDLITWNRLDAPVLSCDDVPWAYCDSLNGNTAFRDPFLLEDQQAPGEWWMFYSTNLAEDSTSMIQGVANAGGLDRAWMHVGRLWVTNETVTGSKLSESAHMFEHDGLYFLLWTTYKTQAIVWATSADPIGPLSAWNYRGTLSSMLGFDTSPWFASEHLRDGLVDYFAAASLTAIEILRMQWTGPVSFQLLQPSSFHVRALTWSRSVAAAGDTAALTIQATGWYGHTASIEVLEVDANGSETLVPASQVGLPAEIPLSGNTTVFTWTARDYPDPGDGEPGPELRVRMQDQTAIAPIIRVPPAPPTPTPTLPDERSEGFLLRFMARSPLGAAFRIDMAGAARARLDLFDVSGRRVATLHDGSLPRGTTVLRLGTVMRAQAPGVYFARLQAAGGQRTVRFVLAP